MEIKNFGPIEKASVSLRPLTILIGPGNTGKSYAAMLAHSIVSACRTVPGRRPARTVAKDGRPRRLCNAMRDALLALAPEEAAKCPPDTTRQMLLSCGRSLCARLQGELELNLASPARDLIMRGVDRFAVALKSNGKKVLTYGSRGLTLGPLPEIDIVLQATQAGAADRPHIDVSTLDDGAIRCRTSRDLIASGTGPGTAARMCELIEERMLPRMIPDLPAASVYFPAARTGILQAHRAVASGITRGSAYGGVENNAPRLPGAASDLASALFNMYPIHGPYYGMGRTMEADMYGGHVNLKHSNRHGAPDLVYEQRGKEVPIQRASSTISELAPLALCLKHLAVRGGMLVVEEPEAHLHPESQIRLAGHMAGLVRNGLNLVITTHSATLL